MGSGAFRTRVEIIPGYVDLLFSLSSQSLHGDSPSQCTTAAGIALEMVYEAECSLQCIKKAIAFIKVLVLTHFNEQLDVRLACDASAYRVGAVVSQLLPDGMERPIGFASQTLSNAEHKYSEIKNAALPCVFGIKKFHSYLYGRHFTFQTNHKPLLTLFSNAQAVSPQVSGLHFIANKVRAL